MIGNEGESVGIVTDKGDQRKEKRNERMKGLQGTCRSVKTPPNKLQQGTPLSGSRIMSSYSGGADLMNYYQARSWLRIPTSRHDTYVRSTCAATMGCQGPSKMCIMFRGGRGLEGHGQ